MGATKQHWMPKNPEKNPLLKKPFPATHKASITPSSHPFALRKYWINEIWRLSPHNPTHVARITIIYIYLCVHFFVTQKDGLFWLCGPLSCVLYKTVNGKKIKTLFGNSALYMGAFADVFLRIMFYRGWQVRHEHILICLRPSCVLHESDFVDNLVLYTHSVKRQDYILNTQRRVFAF